MRKNLIAFVESDAGKERKVRLRHVATIYKEEIKYVKSLEALKEFIEFTKKHNCKKISFRYFINFKI